MSDFPTYGDVLGRPASDPDRDEIRARADWTPVRLPGGGWRHWINGQQVDSPDPDPPRPASCPPATAPEGAHP